MRTAGLEATALQPRHRPIVEPVNAELELGRIDKAGSEIVGGADGRHS